MNIGDQNLLNWRSELAHFTVATSCTTAEQQVYDPDRTAKTIGFPNRRNCTKVTLIADAWECQRLVP